MNQANLSPRDLVSALLVVLIWGSNFVVMKIGLHDIGPMLLGGLRFGLASIPLLLFIRPPALPWTFVVGYGLAQGLGQFGFLFLALSLGLPSGVASIVLQTQAFFTILLAAALLDERIRINQWLGLLASTIGLALILLSGPAGGVHVPVLAFLFCIAGAAMWAVSNIVAGFARRHNDRYDPLSLIVWSSAAPVIPFFMLAWWREGAAATRLSLTHFTAQGIGAVLFLVIASTLVAYSLWAQLLKRHAAAKVAPFSLLVPVVGLFASWLVFDERLTPTQWMGVGVVAVGLLLGNFGHLVGIGRLQDQSG